MRRTAVYICILLIFSPRAIAQDLTWQRVSSMPLGTFNAAVSIANDRFILTGGINQAGAALDAVQVYDPGADQWTLPMKLPAGRHSHAQVTLNDGRVLIIAGQAGRLSERFRPVASGLILDLADNTVTPIPDLPHAVAHPTAHRLADGRVALVGERTVGLFSPESMQWERFITLRQSRREHASVLLGDGRILIAGGAGRSSLEAVEVRQGVSQLLAARLPAALDDLSASLLPDGRVWIMGGQLSSSGRTSDATWILDLSNPRAATLSGARPLGVEGGVADHCAVDLGRWVVVAGGESEVGGSDIELATARICDRRTLEVWSLPDLVSSADDAAAVRLGNAVYVLGGYYKGPELFGKIRMHIASRAVQRFTMPPDRVELDH